MVKRSREESTADSTSSQWEKSDINSSQTKYVALDTTDEGMHDSSLLDTSFDLASNTSFAFGSSAEPEIHGMAAHGQRCIECYKQFPSAYLLEVHIVEFHDPITAIRRERGEATYNCFMEACQVVFEDERRRREHLIAEHEFPRDYNFFVCRDGIDNHLSLLLPPDDLVEGENAALRHHNG